MEQAWFSAAVWLGLALSAALLAIRLRNSVALTEIVVGTVAQLLLGAALGPSALGANQDWITFPAGVGAIVLTFLAGAKLQPASFRKSSKEATVIGLISFAAPFPGAAWAANGLLGWDRRPSWLVGVALSTTSVATVYGVMLELGLNKTHFGKVIVAACFVTDLGTVIALGLLVAPFTIGSLLCDIWFVARHHDADTILITCRGGHRQRGGSDPDRQPLLSAASPST